MVKITIRSGGATGKIVEFAPEGEFLIFEEQAAFGMDKPGKRVLINIKLIDTIEIMQD